VQASSIRLASWSAIACTVVTMIIPLPHDGTGLALFDAFGSKTPVYLILRCANSVPMAQGSSHAPPAPIKTAGPPPVVRTGRPQPTMSNGRTVRDGQNPYRFAVATPASPPWPIVSDDGAVARAAAPPQAAPYAISSSIEDSPHQPSAHSSKPRPPSALGKSMPCRSRRGGADAAGRRGRKPRPRRDRQLLRDLGPDRPPGLRPERGCFAFRSGRAEVADSCRFVPGAWSRCSSFGHRAGWFHSTSRPRRASLRACPRRSAPDRDLARPAEPDPGWRRAPKRAAARPSAYCQVRRWVFTTGPLSRGGRSG
jgi:hypothetical protein